MAADAHYVLGIDGGGTKCLARLETHHGELIAEAISGPANPAQDAAQALDSVTLACREIQQIAGLTDAQLAGIPAVLGLAGVSIPAYHQRTTSWQLPVSRFMVTTDLHTACVGAHGSEEGAIVITGTGSSAFISHQGQHTILGGHGFQLGDAASGAWLGQRALSCTLEALDGLSSAHNLAHHLCQTLGQHTTADIVGSALHFRSAQFAQLAPVVITLAQQGDEDAIAIMRQGADYLNRLIRKLLSLHPVRLSMLGGLAGVWSQWLDNDLQGQLSDVLNGPAAGACTLARHHQW